MTALFWKGKGGQTPREEEEGLELLKEDDRAVQL